MITATSVSVVRFTTPPTLAVCELLELLFLSFGQVLTTELRPSTAYEIHIKEGAEDLAREILAAARRRGFHFEATVWNPGATPLGLAFIPKSESAPSDGDNWSSDHV